jgi:serine protease Do
MRRFHGVSVRGLSVRGLWGWPLRLAVLLGVIALVCAGAARADEVGADRSETIRRLLPSVVSISVKKFQIVTAGTSAQSSASATADPGSSIKYYVGSGFVIDASGLILTNYHVVEDAFEVSVKFLDGTTLEGNTLHASRVADLAIIRVQADRPLAATRWGNSDALQVGDQVFVMGNPFGVGLSVSGGIVSALNRNLQDTPYDDYIQTDAAINHGNSGGPLFDLHGDVVGVNSELISPTKGFVGLGFAIPAGTARFVVDQLQTYGWDRPSWVGLKVQLLTPELANAAGIEPAGGSLVSWVIPGGPANKAGLEIGDVIVRFDNGAPSDDRSLLRDIARTPAGTAIDLIVRRNGVERTLPMVTEVWPRNQWEARDAPVPVQQPHIAMPPGLGLALSPIEAAARSKLGVPDGWDAGVLVSSVEAYTDAARQGLAAGDIILRVQDRTVAAPADVQSGIDTVRGLKRQFVQMLVLPKVRTAPGPRWYALQVADSNN